MSRLLHYINIHKISLQQDLDKLNNKMEELDPNSKDFKELDFEYNHLNGQIYALGYILEVAKELD